MLIARIWFVFSGLLLLTNCAGQPDLSKYALADGSAVQDFTPVQRLAKPRTHLSTRPRMTSGQTPKPVAPVQSADLTSTVGTARSSSVQPLRPSVEPVRSSIAPLPVLMRPLPYVDQLAKDDKEDQYLALKTKICRGC